MKRILIFITATVLLMSACGKKDKAPVNENSEVKAQEKIVSENNASESTSFLEEFEAMADEFNSTKDPERKEELRDELEKILADAEKAYDK